jgi:hypothetical protein
MWHGWTSLEKADQYEHYLRQDLFPRVKAELGNRGYRGFHVLRFAHANEVEFVTLLWFDSLESVVGFAGERYATPVISEKARSLLSRYDAKVEHYELSASSWQGFATASGAE